ncbi:MAG: hypothetical protein COT18_08810 [Elusimicrobia bacterium CG08_land_8_20_14_0_20_59_10]|nr:MAG: hypothetical protein COT18_08810 [Elusimicrobia bacterium CG08_land_8_20_14_0_20_59_10]
MPGAGDKALFLRLPGAKAEEIAELFPPPAHFITYIDGAAVPDKAALMEALAAAFSFPAYFGKNWDALLDCLRSLPDGIPAKGYVLAVKNSGSFLSAAPADLEAFTEIAAEAKKFLAEKAGAGFRIVFL